MKNKITNWENIFIQYLNDHPTADKSHDVDHSRRVWSVASKLASVTKSHSGEETDLYIILAAAYLHDIVSYPKNHPNRALSSKDSAIKAEQILTELSFPCEKISAVKHCIEAHSFSANIEPQTIEAKIVQDADRMEGLGAIGLARTFYVGGQLGIKLFDQNDPLGTNRILDDKEYSLDHFALKLFKLPDLMKTQAGKQEAQKRVKVLKRYVDDLLSEIFSY